MLLFLRLLLCQLHPALSPCEDCAQKCQPQSRVLKLLASCWDARSQPSSLCALAMTACSSLTMSVDCEYLFCTDDSCAETQVADHALDSTTSDNRVSEPLMLSRRAAAAEAAVSETFCLCSSCLRTSSSCCKDDLSNACLRRTPQQLAPRHASTAAQASCFILPALTVAGNAPALETGCPNRCLSETTRLPGKHPTAGYGWAVATFLHKESFNLSRSKRRDWSQVLQRQGLAHLAHGRAKHISEAPSS